MKKLEVDLEKKKGKMLSRSGKLTKFCYYLPLAVFGMCMHVGGCVCWVCSHTWNPSKAVCALRWDQPTFLPSVQFTCVHMHNED